MFDKFMFTKEQSDSYTKLDALLKLGSDLIQSIDTSNFSLKEEKCFLIIIAIQKRISSVCYLCQVASPPGCYEILRTCLEYMFTYKLIKIPESPFYELFLFQSTNQKKKALEENLAFLQKKNEFRETLTEVDLKKSLKKATQIVEASKAKLTEHISGPWKKYINMKSPEIKLFKKSEILDDHNSNENLSSQSYKELYHLIFRQLCTFSHSSLDDLKYYTKFYNEQVGEIKSILDLAQYIYKEVYEDLKKLSPNINKNTYS